MPKAIMKEEENKRDVVYNNVDGSTEMAKLHSSKWDCFLVIDKQGNKKKIKRWQLVKDW